jgi:multidrug transporter EmrE-like cation transporter
VKQGWAVAFALGNLVGILTSNVALKLSAQATHWSAFLRWQILGNLCGFLGVLCFTGLVRLVPLSVGYGVTAGLGFVLVQVVAARLFFGEDISSLQWLGVTLVAVGIALIAAGRGRG